MITATIDDLGHPLILETAKNLAYKQVGLGFCRPQDHQDLIQDLLLYLCRQFSRYTGELDVVSWACRRLRGRINRINRRLLGIPSPSKQRRSDQTSVAVLPPQLAEAESLETPRPEPQTEPEPLGQPLTRPISAPSKEDSAPGLKALASKVGSWWQRLREKLASRWIPPRSEGESVATDPTRIRHYPCLSEPSKKGHCVGCLTFEASKRAACDPIFYRCEIIIVSFGAL